jgi:hypothetical protein
VSLKICLAACASYIGYEPSNAYNPILSLGEWNATGVTSEAHMEGLVSRKVNVEVMR